MRVLVTRPRHQTEALAELLREAGAEPIVCPLIRVEPLPVDAVKLRRTLERKWDWFLFTSANGVSGFGASLQQAGLDWRATAGGRLGVMGPGTAAELRARELRVDFAPSRAIAESLAAELPDVAAGTCVLLARAEEAREALPELLRARGAQVEILPVYRTVKDENGAAAAVSALAAGDVDAVTFTSVSTVHQLVAAAGARALVGRLIASIGPITSEAARKHGLSVDVEAAEHTIPGLVSALIEHARQQKRTGA